MSARPAAAAPGAPLTATQLVEPGRNWSPPMSCPFTDSLNKTRVQTSKCVASTTYDVLYCQTVRGRAIVALVPRGGRTTRGTAWRCTRSPWSCCPLCRTSRCTPRTRAWCPPPSSSGSSQARPEHTKYFWPLISFIPTHSQTERAPYTILYAMLPAQCPTKLVDGVIRGSSVGSHLNTNNL